MNHSNLGQANWFAQLAVARVNARLIAQGVYPVGFRAEEFTALLGGGGHAMQQIGSRRRPRSSAATILFGVIY